MKKLILIPIILLSGCMNLIKDTPSMQYCSKVNYVRVGNQVSISAECAVPLGNEGLPIPLPKP